MERETQKNLAIKCMERLDIFKPYINAFKTKQQKVCLFEGFGGFYIEKSSDLGKKIKELEKEKNVTVYAVTHEKFEFGERYSMLVIGSDDDFIVEDYVHYCGHGYSTFAYVWNVDAEDCSEFGSVGIQDFGGGIRRVW